MAVRRGLAFSLGPHPPAHAKCHRSPRVMAAPQAPYWATDWPPRKMGTWPELRATWLGAQRAGSCPETPTGI